MEFPINYIAAGQEYCTHEKHFPAPYIRKSFFVTSQVTKAEILICGLGFYELYINGTNITKGALAPYISAPDDLVYFDQYDISHHLTQGENVIGIILGNGMQNAFGGHIWQFDKAKWRGAPKTALRVEIKYKENEQISIFESDTSFKTNPSPIIFDDMRCGEWYDARLEQEGWNKPGFDDSSWKNAILAPMPKGEPTICRAEPIVVTHKIKPVSIMEQDNGFLFDFGVNCAGVCELMIEGDFGQEINLQYGEHLIDGKLSQNNISFVRPEQKGTVMVQTGKYICKGIGIERYLPGFIYYGFRYVLVQGVTTEQATENLLTYFVMNSDLEERGGFSCSDEMANTLQEITRRSDLSNFFYFPNDCPQREKNGWTADAALSSEHMLLNLSPERSYREWLKNIRYAQSMNGSLPGIVPTGGWGFEWGNGPAWDAVLTELPYQTYMYRGNTDILQENVASIFRYLHYLNRNRDEKGLIAIGLGDWCPVGRGAGSYKSPLIFTDSVISMDICTKAAYIFDVLKMEPEKEYAEKLYGMLRNSIRKYLIDFPTMTAIGNCQTSQAMAIHYNVFEKGEKPEAFRKLLKLVELADNSMDVGVLGGRVLFHVLSQFGKADLAYHMITKPEFPSYGNWVKRGATTLWEDFQPEGGKVSSLNHHFWGDISSWFIQTIAGIRLNPYGTSINEVNIMPKFITKLESAQGFHIAPAGKITTNWKRVDDKIILEVSIPKTMSGKIILDNDYVFEKDGLAIHPIECGEFYLCIVKH